MRLEFLFTAYTISQAARCLAMPQPVNRVALFERALTKRSIFGPKLDAANFPGKRAESILSHLF
jgi:hypothetical protein